MEAGDLGPGQIWLSLCSNGVGNGTRGIGERVEANEEVLRRRRFIKAQRPGGKRVGHKVTARCARCARLGDKDGGVDDGTG